MQVTELVSGEVYTEGCIKELTRLMQWGDATKGEPNKNIVPGAMTLATSNVLYIGDSLFADLVDAKREFGWITAGKEPTGPIN